jgi:hypothetical protein
MPAPPRVKAAADVINIANGLGRKSNKMSVVPIAGSERYRAKTWKPGAPQDAREDPGQDGSLPPTKIPPIPGNLGADFFASLEYETRLKAGIPGAEEKDGGEEVRPALSFRTARALRGDGDGIEIDARLLRGVQSRWEEIQRDPSARGRKFKEIQREFKSLAAAGGGSARTRPQTPRELKEQKRRADALARIKAAGGRGGPACGRRANHEVQHLLQTSMQVDPSLVNPDRRQQWHTPRGSLDGGGREFPFGPPARGQLEQPTTGDDNGEGRSDEQKKADELRALAAGLAGEMTQEEKDAALQKRKEECKLRALTPDNWRCKTSAATSTKPRQWQWTGVAGALAADDPSAVTPGEDPRWSERDLSLVELCDASDLDVDVIRAAAIRSSAAQWSAPDASGRTALHAICMNAALHQDALEVILDHAPFDAWCCCSDQGGTPLHFLCANQTAFSAKILSLVLQRAAESLALISRPVAIAGLWNIADDTGCTPLHALCSNGLGIADDVEIKDSAMPPPLSLAVAAARADADFKLLHAQVKHEVHAQAALEAHLNAPDGRVRIHMDAVERAFVNERVLLAMAAEKPVDEAIASARDDLRKYTTYSLTPIYIYIYIYIYGGHIKIDLNRERTLASDVAAFSWRCGVH